MRGQRSAPATASSASKQHHSRRVIASRETADGSAPPFASGSPNPVSSPVAALLLLIRNALSKTKKAARPRHSALMAVAQHVPHLAYSSGPGLSTASAAHHWALISCAL